MAWNGSDRKNGKPAARRPAPSKRNPRWHGPVAGLCAVIGVGIAAWLLLVGPADGKKPSAVKDRKDVVASVKEEPVESAEESPREHMRRRIEEAVSDKVRDYITKPATNKMDLLKKPIADDDPDRGLLTRVSAELATLLASTPGDKPMPWPYAFMDEDKRRANGGKGDGDGGTAEFVASIKKYKIAVKDGDDEHRIEFKKRMLEAQGELLEGIDAGVSVNDSIRAAYEFRVKAYELRSTAVKTMREFLDEGDTVENTREVLKEMNAKLESEGIRTISEEELGIEEEEE